MYKLVTINQHRCWPREWKRSIAVFRSSFIRFCSIWPDSRLITEILPTVYNRILLIMLLLWPVVWRLDCYVSLFTLLAITCNFDVSTCGFLQDKNDKFNWTRHKGPTLSSGTGPSSDHTSGNGKIIFWNSLLRRTPLLLLIRCFPFCLLSVLGYGTGLDGVLESFYWYKYTCTLS